MWSFLENKARIKIDRFKQLPALHSAVKEGNISDVRIYLHRGCDINEQDVYGKTPLHYTYEKNNIEILNILLQCPRIKRSIKDNDGHIA